MLRISVWIIAVGLSTFAFLIGFGLMNSGNSSFYRAVNINQNAHQNNANASANFINAPEKISAGPFHYSNFSDRSFYDKAFEKAGDVQNVKEVVIGAIVNHHLLAPDLIAETLAASATDELKTVVLISPNHFFAGQGQAIISEYDWQTPYGILEANKDVISRLADGPYPIYWT